MGNKLVGRHGLHIYPFEPAEMILDPQSFFKQAAELLLVSLFNEALLQSVQITDAKPIEGRPWPKR